MSFSQLKEQRESQRGIDQKVSGLIGISATLVGVAAIVLKDFSGSPEGLSWVSALLASVIALTFLAEVYWGYQIMKPREFRHDPDLEKFSEYLGGDYADDAFVGWMGDQLRNSVSYNDKMLKAKVEDLHRALWTMGLLVALTVALTVSIGWT